MFSFLNICSEKYILLKLSFSHKVLYSSQCSLEILGKSIIFSRPESFYLMQDYQLLKCKTFCGKRGKAVLWLQLWPKGHAFSKYDFIQVVRARAVLKKIKIRLRQTGELSFFSLFLLTLWSYYAHNQTVCLPQTKNCFMAFQQIQEILDSVSSSLPDFSNFLHDHKAYIKKCF